MNRLAAYHQCNEQHQRIYVRDIKLNQILLRVDVTGKDKETRDDILRRLTRIFKYPEKCNGHDIINVTFDHIGA